MTRQVWHFAIPVNPEQWAIGPVGVTNKGGKARGFVGQNQQLRTYQDAVRVELNKQIASIGADGYFPVKSKVKFVFYFWRRLDVYQTPTGRQSSRNWADATNMQKALEDALQGVLIHNDRDNVDVRSIIVEQSVDTTPGCIVEMHVDPVVKLELNPEVLNWALERFADADKFIFDNTI